MPDLTVVIPTLGTRPSLMRVVERLNDDIHRSVDFEVVIVGHEAEVPLERIRELTGEVRVPLRVIDRSGPGVSFARNAGWRDAQADLVLFLDDDVLPSGPLLAEHLAWHRREPADEIGVLGHVRWAPEVRVTPFMRWLEQGIQFDYPNIEGTEAGWGRFYTANISVKRAILERVGGFDEAIPFLYEDIDLGYRLNEVGFRLLYNRNAVGDHLHVTDIDEWRRRAPAIARAEQNFVAMHPDIRPYFYDRFRSAAGPPPARGRGRWLTAIVPRSVPWLGRRVWLSTDRYFTQQLAPYFLAGWADGDGER